MNSLDILARLISFDTTSHKTNLPLMQFVQTYLKENGVESYLVHDETGQKANLFATIGSDTGDGIVLSGHTDVVPVEGQIWSYDPFEMTERNGRLYGRGSCDMKGFVASAMAIVPYAVKANLKKPIHLAFSHDEEIGCLGVRSLLKKLQKENFTAEICVVGEPTLMDVITGHKGKETVMVEFFGKAAHSSLTPSGVNAIEYAARAMVKVREIANRIRKSGPFDQLFDVPHTTAQVGLVSGGAASNIVPQYASFVFEFRTLPQDDLDGLVNEVRRYVYEVLEPEMKAEDSASYIKWTSRAKIPALQMQSDDPATVLIKKLAERNTESKVAFGTEAGLFQTWLNIPTIVCGPGSIDQAHKPDEFVERSQMERCDRFLERLVDYACE